ncbi:DUF4194 domain-containing protein [Pleionea sp. CnH1-48]|uniref:DUF4194 domain-containing protein n=1 Tax=Pleionea sp. CnH1-48 TaxID=2954494 RepID=UPI0020972282|nr:DUF4194 domain-containing protein [Pleionea sp. CnH1-48]MCO7226260.1 DUF4194 domain-containing protein [Pleionea sp. CnH1-48]
MILSNLIEDSLESKNLSLNDFQELIIRLMNYSVLCRSESATEEQLYDRFVRIEELVRDYLSVAHIQLHHDSQFQYVRLYPPAAEIPGVKEPEESAFSGSLRQRLTQNEVALVLILRVQYDKALREGKIDDSGYALESLESISIAMKNMLRRPLPEKLTDRKKMFQRLRQLRLIQYRQDEEFSNGESWIKIHPMIVTFINEDALAALSEDNVEPTDEEAVAQENDEQVLAGE